MRIAIALLLCSPILSRAQATSAGSVATPPPLRSRVGATLWQTCTHATQPIRVPEDIHLIGSCQEPPEIIPSLSFLLSDSGTDIYRVQWPKKSATSPAAKREQEYAAQHPRYPLSVTALFVFQDEMKRQAEVKALLQAGDSLNWLRGGARPDSTLPADWTPAFSIKYATYTFTVLGDNGSLSGPKISAVLLVEAHLYAPTACNIYGTRCVNGQHLNWESAPGFGSSEIANFYNRSPPELPETSIYYKVAVMLAQLRMAEAKSDGQ